MFERMFEREKVEAVVHKFGEQPKGTEGVVRLSDVIIPHAFAETKPMAYKFKKYKRLFYELGNFDKPITVIAETNEKGNPNKLILADGYVRYLIAKRFKLKYIPVKYIVVDEYVMEHKTEQVVVQDAVQVEVETEKYENNFRQVNQQALAY